jgi:hypothetical protein
VDWLHLLDQIRIVFMLGFALFAAWLVVKWVRHAWATALTVRDWHGAFAFWLGILSSSVLGYLYAYFWVTHKLLVTSGLGLRYLLELGSYSAVGGLLFGLAGRGWVRRAAAFISVVAAFQWASFFSFYQGIRGYGSDACYACRGNALVVWDSPVLRKIWIA